ncbi:MAG: 1-(5-phosphoribosyl)-5-[(5-phosphoribosylamino)methylideneamino]imidazole-4-carboxamide isomerase [bacterium]|nr:1-(5-phosphoribosyl)-5-[(5-phosphoribosylamino)methylideneamino]imidazole-4-carboxamide isomerase [bacterium]
MEVIPAIDLRAGRVVNLVQGDYERETVFSDDAAETARSFVAAGATRIHVVDLDAARDGGEGNQNAIDAIVSAAGGVPVQVGGGVRSAERVASVLGRGLQRVIIGTAALEQPELLREVAEQYPDRIVLGVDARDGRIAVHGWMETSEVTPLELLTRYAGSPLGAVLHTDIALDGMMQGPNIAATEQLARATKFSVIASGGVSCTEDLLELARTRVIAGAIVGRAIYTGALDLADAIQRVGAC